MNITRAQQINGHIAQLAELATTFNARYGCGYTLSEVSPREAWELHRQTMATQAMIANLLDVEATLTPFIRYGRWWDKQDVPTLGIITEMAQEAIRLVTVTSTLEALGEDDAFNHKTRPIQESIAGMLHPHVRQRTIEQTA